MEYILDGQHLSSQSVHLKMLEIDYLQRNKNQQERTSNEHLQLYNLASPSYDMQPVIAIDQPLVT